MENIHTYEMRILERHLDTFGHVNNATYLEIYEEARWDLFEKHGMSLQYIHEHSEGPVVLDVYVKYKKELSNREHIRVETTYKGKKNSLVLLMEQKIFNEAGEICSMADFSFGILDFKKRRLFAPTPIWMKSLGAETD